MLAEKALDLLPSDAPEWVAQVTKRAAEAVEPALIQGVDAAVKALGLNVSEPAVRLGIQLAINAIASALPQRVEVEVKKGATASFVVED